jgi:glycerol dehydrogenase-like iron-containing ADH family enzyme
MHHHLELRLLRDALAAHGRLTPCGVLAIHDYWNRRAYQQGLDDFFETIGAAGTMALLKPRLVEAAALAQALERHAADPR